MLKTDGRLLLLALCASLASCSQRAAPEPSPGRETAHRSELPDYVYVTSAMGAPGAETLTVAKRWPVVCGDGTSHVDTHVVAPDSPAVTLTAGPHRLHIPAGAVRSRTTFRLVDVGSRTHLLVRASAHPAGTMVDEVQLTLNYDTCGWNGDPAGLSVVRLEDGQPGTTLPSSPDGAGGIVARLTSFSDFALVSAQ